jgi:hypothetical protein
LAGVVLDLFFELAHFLFVLEFGLS